MLSIIIPTYNEKENIEPLLKKIDKVLKKRKIKFEILIADSNSKDHTKEEVKRVAKEYKIHAKAIKAGNTDLSSAVLITLKKTKNNLVCVMDADLQHPPEMIPLMLKKLKKDVDFVNASRFLPGSKCEFGLERGIISKGFQFLTKIIVPKAKQLTDTASGFFLFKKEIIKKTRLRPVGFKIMLEILAKGNINKIVEVPIHFKKRERGKSKLNMKQVFLVIKHLWRLSKLEWNRWLKFLIVGVSGIVVNMGLLWILTESGLHYLASGAIAIESSIISNFLLNDVWTFRDRRKGNFFRRAGKFNIARITAAVINFAALWLFTFLGVHYLISNFIGIALATIFSYITSIIWVWK
jgi:dolichol-phosphate mannosyltransferase